MSYSRLQDDVGAFRRGLKGADTYKAVGCFQDMRDDPVLSNMKKIPKMDYGVSWSGGLVMIYRLLDVE